MKKTIASLAFAVIATALMADTSVRERHRPPHPKSRPSGGLVEKQYHGKVFRVLNLQTVMLDEKLALLTREIRHRVLLPIESRCEIKTTDKWLEVAANLVAQKDVGAGAIVIDDPVLPTELVSPDARWGILNIRPLMADNPSQEVFEMRFRKVYWGIIARTLGAGTSSFPGCVLVPFSTLKELDAITATQPCPEPYNKMIDTGKYYGIDVLTITTYRTACQQGWAAQPTNDVQKAIWNEVHTLPTEPIRIKPETSKQK